MTSTADGFFDDVDTIDEAFFGDTVEVRRGGMSTTGVVAIAEDVNNEFIDDRTLTQAIIRSRDYVVTATNYKIGGQVVDPKPGDQIIETINGVATTFEAMPIGKLPAVEREFEDGKRWRIRTKEIS